MEKNKYQIIQGLCKYKGITIAYLERELGLSNGQIKRWKDSAPSVDNAGKVAEYFNVSIEYLIGKENNNDNYILPSMTDDMFEVVGKMQDMTKEQQKQVRDIVNVLDRK